MNQLNQPPVAIPPPMQEREVRFKPNFRQWEAYQALFDETTTELGYGGAGNGGKTYLGSVFAILMTTLYPGMRGVIGRKELKNLKRTTLMTLFKVFRAFGYRGNVDYVYNQQDQIIRWNNANKENNIPGSEILLLDLAANPSDPLFTELGGLEIGWYWVDESNEVSVLAINTLSTRLGRSIHPNIKPIALETFNPDKGHVYSRYWKPYMNGLEGKGNALPPHRKFIRSLPRDNPYCPPEWIQQVLNTGNKTLIERLIYGNFEYEDDPMALFDPDTIMDMFTLNVAPKPEVNEEGEITKPIEKFISCDVARFGSDKTIIKVFYGLQVKKIHIMARSRTTDVSKKLDEICKAETIPRSHVVVDEDGVGGGVVDEFSGCKGFLNGGSPIHPPGAARDPNLKANYANLKTQCYYKLAEYVAAGLIGYDETPEQLREQIKEELLVIKRANADHDGKLQIISKERMKELLGRSPDFADALMMRMYFELKPKKQFSFTSLA